MIFWAYRKRVDDLYEQYIKGDMLWRDILELYLADYKKNAKFILNIMKNTHGNDSYYSGSSSYMLKRLREAFQTKLGVEKLDDKTDMLLCFYVAGIVNSIGYWLDKRIDIDEKEMAEILDMAMPEYLRTLYRNN